MSQGFSLVCHETKSKVLVGQGWGTMTTFYSGEPKTMKALKVFLNDCRDKPIHFVCMDTLPDDRDDIFDYTEYSEKIKE